MKNYPLNITDKYEDFKHFADGIAARYGENPAVSFYRPDGEIETFSYRKMTGDIFALAEELAERGLSGKHAALIGQNSYMYIVALLAVTYIGGTAVPIDIEQPVETIRSMVDFADAEFVFVSESMREVVAPEDCFPGRPYMILSEDPRREKGFMKALEAGRALIAGRGRKCADQTVDPDRTAVIVYTSGTTSTSKPVMLSHRAILSNACESLEMVDLPKRVFTSLPLYHVYGLTCALLNNLVNGAEICVNGDIRYMLRDFAAFKPKTMMAVPLIAEMLCKKLLAFVEGADIKKGVGFPRKTGPVPKLVEVKEKIFPNLELMICGGAHLSPQIGKTLLKFGILVLQGYGITECGPLVSVSRNGFFKMETVGVVLPNYEIRLEGGEILVRGKSLMKGYYKQPEFTREAMADGWFRTGDLGYIDSQGFLNITGRKKNIIVLKNGKKVSPEELELLLHEIPMVKEAMVYGSAIGTSADDVVPAVTVYPDQELTKGMSAYEILNELQTRIDEINAKLPAFKQIRLVNIREKEFTKTSTKKIKRAI